MKLAIAIHKDPGSVYGVTVPDVPGCFSSGETIEEAIASAQEAVYFHLEGLIEDGEKFDINPTPIDVLQAAEEFAGAVWALVDIDEDRIDPKPERVNISIPRYVLRRIDEWVYSHHESRSGFLARAAIKEMENASVLK